MPTERITWTALPNGIVNNRFRLSVYVSPRLETDEADATLALFPDFLDWPAQIQSIKTADLLSVQLTPGTISLARIMNPVLDSDLWRMIFSSDLRVCPYRYKTLTGRNILTYNTREILNQIRLVYGQEVGDGYSPDRDLERTRQETREIRTPLEERTLISDYILRLLEDLSGRAIEERPDCEGVEQWYPFFTEMIIEIARALIAADRLSLSDPTDLRELAERFVEIVLMALENPTPNSLVELMLGGDIRFTPELLSCWLRLIAEWQTEPELRAFYLLLSQGIDPQITEIIRIREEVRFEQVTVPLERPFRKHADDLRNRLGNIGDDLRRYYEVSSDPAHQLPPDPCDYDFHSLLGSLGQYPEILRRLGIILDLEFDGQAGAAELDTQLVVNWNSETPEMVTVNVTPQSASAFISTPADYSMRSRPGGQIRNGFVNVGNTVDYTFVPIDVEGTAFKAANFDRTLQDIDDEAIFVNNDYIGVPALRTAGLGVAHNGRKESLEALSAIADDNNDLLNAGQMPEKLFLDDVARGFRVDIRDGDQSWHSVCLRTGQFIFDTEPARTFNHNDEGWIVPSLVEQPDVNGNPQAKLTDVLFKWEGWSLTNRRPGSVVDTAGTIQTRDELKDPNAVVLPFDYVSRVPPGSLPRLRFGRRYRMRVRVADLAGNGRSLPSDTAPGVATAEETFRRFEPLASPTFVLQRAMVPDDAGDVGRTSDELIIRTLNDELGKDREATTDTDIRYVAPAQSSQLMAEMYGVFDAVIGQNASGDRAAFYTQIAAKDRGKFIAIIDAAGEEIDTRIDPSTLSGELLPLPYLPDPAIRSIVLVNLPGAPTEQIGDVDSDGTLRYSPPYSDVVGYLNVSITRIPVFDGIDYPNSQPFKLVLREGDGRPEWNNIQRTLVVSLQKGHATTVLVSAAGEMQDHGLLDWFRVTLGSSIVDRERLRNVEDAVRFGVHRMITPSRAIRLTHAVQQPIGRPGVERLRLLPDVPLPTLLGATYVDLDSEFWAHALSTVKVHLLAEWTQNVDEPPRGYQPAVPHQQLVLEQPMLLQDDPDAGNRPGESFNFVSETTRVGRVTRHEFGDTKYRLIRYRLQAINRYRSLFPPEDPAVAVPPVYTRESDTFELIIPNRERPQTPKPVLVIPTFRWVREQNGDQATSQRFCGLRVYLERPWFSSGDGELLGVVTSLQPRDTFDTSIDTPFAGPEWTEGDPRITHWGGDPIWDANRVFKFRAEDARKPDDVSDAVWEMRRVNARWDGRLLNLVSQSTPADARVLGFEPVYDANRDEWFVDLEFVDAAFYFPILRFALCRFQPISVNTAHFSEVVMTDFAQIPPRRSVTFSDIVSNQVTIRVEGMAYRGRANEDMTIDASTSRVRAVVQRRSTDIADPDLGWENIPTTEVDLMLTTPLDATSMVWQGVLPIPATVANQQQRILVSEYEQFRPWQAVTMLNSYPTERVTFMETLRIG
ncbi:MAG: hypothetical protein SF123_11395 [Chloroflexota bacterium]|nr:hypothetical protein [Chloroflexota bacterium]